MKQLLQTIMLICIPFLSYSQEQTLDLSAESIKISDMPENEVVCDHNGDKTVKVIIESEIPNLSFEGSVFSVKPDGNKYELLLLEGAKRLIIYHPEYLTANIMLPFPTKGGTVVSNVQVTPKVQTIDQSKLSLARTKQYAKVSVECDEYAELFIDGIKVPRKTEFYYLSPGVHVFSSNSPLGEYARTVEVEATDGCGGIVDVRNGAYVRLAVNPATLDYRRELYITPNVPEIGILSETASPEEYKGAILKFQKLQDEMFFIPLQAVYYTDFSGYTLPRIYSPLYSNNGKEKVYTPSVRDLVTLSLSNGHWEVSERASLPDGTTYRVVSGKAVYDDIESPFDIELSELLNSEEKEDNEQDIRIHVVRDDWCTLYVDGEKYDHGTVNFVTSPGIHIFESKYGKKKYKIKVNVEPSENPQIVDVCLGGEIWVYIPLSIYGSINHELLYGKNSIAPNYTVAEDGYFTANGQSIPCKIIKHAGLLGKYAVKEETPKLNTTVNPINGHIVSIPGDTPHRTSINVDSRTRVEVFLMPNRMSQEIQVVGVQGHYIVNESKGLQ